MRKLILGTLAAVALMLGFGAAQASAAWVSRPVTYWDPACAQYVTTTQTYWVPDPVVAVPFYRHVEHRWGEHHRHEGHHEHHRR